MGIVLSNWSLILRIAECKHCFSRQAQCTCTLVIIKVTIGAGCTVTGQQGLSLSLPVVPVLDQVGMFMALDLHVI